MALGCWEVQRVMMPRALASEAEPSHEQVMAQAVTILLCMSRVERNKSCADWVLCMGWKEYWEHDSTVYVSPRHKSAHYDRLADDILGYANQSAVPVYRQRVLDYGCGEALSSARIAGNVGALFLCDGSSRVSDELEDRFGLVDNITVLKPDTLDAVADASVDLIVVNSVLQYVDPAAAGPLLKGLARKLAPTGEMLVADVLPPDLGALTDAGELLKFAAQQGFLSAAVIGLARAAVSDYARTRARHGLTRYSAADFERLAAATGLRAQALPRNLGHNPHRLAFVVRVAALAATKASVTTH